MSKWHDTTRCISCGYEITGLGTGDGGEVQCPECGDRNAPSRRSAYLASKRRRTTAIVWTSAIGLLMSITGVVLLVAFVVLMAILILAFSQFP